MPWPHLDPALTHGLVAAGTAALTLLRGWLQDRIMRRQLAAPRERAIEQVQSELEELRRDVQHRIRRLEENAQLSLPQPKEDHDAVPVATIDPEDTDPHRR